jgi:thioredoxin-dependent peroxiredoxin
MALIKEGSKAPVFKLEDQDGNARSLKDFDHDYIVLFFYPKDNTPGCTLEAQGFSKLSKKFETLSAIPIGISGGDSRSKQKFCLKAQLNVLLLSDTDGATGTKYNTYGEKKFMGKTFTGFHRKTFILNPERKIIKIYDNVKPGEHPEEVLEYIKNLP